MLNVTEALQLILDAVQPLGTEKVPLLKALGRTLARDVVAKEDLPPFDNSSMDGFAILASDTQGGEPCDLVIVGESSAGKPFGGVVESKQTVRIMTGGMMPAGADAVVPLERVTVVDDQHVRVSAPVNTGQYVRLRGEDIGSGETVLRQGKLLNPGTIGVLAALGHERVRVYKKPRVNILATGSELVEIGGTPGPGEIRNSSSYALAAHVLEAGGVPSLCGIVADKPKRLRKEIASALDADVLLITGGVSVGKYDFVRDVLEELGVQIGFHKVNIKPGMPLVFGRYEETLVFGLPGNPVSTGVTFMQFVRPALLKMSGREVLAATHKAVMDEAYKKADGKRHFARGIAERKNGMLHVVTTGNQSSGAISSMSKANCIIIIPEEVSLLREGDEVEVELL